MQAARKNNDGGINILGEVYSMDSSSKSMGRQNRQQIDRTNILASISYDMNDKNKNKLRQRANACLSLKFFGVSLMFQTGIRIRPKDRLACLARV
jgi:hypothetical protein